MALEGVGIILAETAPSALCFRFGRIAAQQFVVKAKDDCIQTQTIHTALQPKFHFLQNLFAHLRAVII